MPPRTPDFIEMPRVCRYVYAARARAFSAAAIYVTRHICRAQTAPPLTFCAKTGATCLPLSPFERYLAIDAFALFSLRRHAAIFTMPPRH
jgi:hypothetical protein